MGLLIDQTIFFEVAYSDEAQSEWAIRRVFGSLDRDGQANATDGACLGTSSRP